ncbi:polysaccharide deacetylase family protein [Paenibacillus rigui]|nr:polysaccharide deacetylase family protein [Paenibacillus rigui]
MLARFLAERKQHWMLGIGLCGMLSLTFTYYSLTGTGNSTLISFKEPHKEPVSAGSSHINASTSMSAEPPSLEVNHSGSASVAQTELGPKLEPLRSTPPMASKQVALTFDDGPDNKYTPQILDILKQNDVKATFFVVGNQASKHPDVLKRIHDEGHAIGNHSWDHANLSKLSASQIEKELKETDQLVLRTIGVTPDLVRAPYGAISASVKEEVSRSGRPLIGWNVDPQDWAGTSAEDMMQNIQSHVKADSIILLHSFGGRHGKLDNTVKALPAIIAYLRGEGFQLVTVPDMKHIR